MAGNKVLDIYLNFGTCNFILNTTYKGLDLDHQIKLGGGKASFITCNIENYTTFTTIDKCAITEIGTRLYVKDCPKISGYYYGIRAFSNTGSYYVVNSKFEKFKFGILSEGVNNFVLTNNDFKCGPYGSIITSTGLVLSTGTNFIIEKNKFFSSNSDKFCTGIEVKFTHNNDENYISSDNIFTGLKYGINCTTFPGNDKLFVTCNDFVNCNEDVRIESSTRLAKIQMFYDQPAGNTFTTPALTSNFYNGWATKIIYHYNSLQANSEPLLFTNIDKIDQQEMGPRCFVQVVDPTDGIEQAKDNFYSQLISNRGSLANDLSILLDNGQSSQLLTSIQNVNSSTVLSIYNNISQLSPNVSAQIVMAVWDQLNFFSAQQRYDLVLNNPLILLENDVREKISIPIEGITETMRNNLLELTIPQSGQRYDLLMQIEGNRANLDNLLKRMINHHIINEDDDLSLSLKWLNRMNNLSSKMDAALIALYSSSYSNLSSIMSNIQQIGNSSTDLNIQDEVLRFIELESFLQTIYLNNRFIGGLTLAEQQSLLTFAESSNKYANKVASNILFFYYNISSEMQYLKRDKIDRNSALKPNNSEIPLAVKGEIIKNNFIIYPNPTKDLLTIRSLNIESLSNSVVEIMDLNGKIVITKVLKTSDSFIDLNTSELKSGAYILKINEEGKEKILTRIIKL